MAAIAASLILDMNIRLNDGENDMNTFVRPKRQQTDRKLRKDRLCTTENTVKRLLQ